MEYVKRVARGAGAGMSATAAQGALARSLQDCHGGAHMEVPLR